MPSNLKVSSKIKSFVCLKSKIKIPYNISSKILNRNTLDGTTKINHREFGVLPVSSLYKQFAVMFVTKKCSNSNNI